MNELHLFAGAGGGILGGILLGHTCLCAVEVDPYCRSVLLQRQRDGLLPRFPVWDDVRDFDGVPWRGRVDAVCGGFPCQDISVAGKGAGIDGERSGLWGEMRRVVSEIRPRFVFVENSPALTIRGFGRVLADLHLLGFNAEWADFSGKEVGTPHDRKRLWLLACDRKRPVGNDPHAHDAFRGSAPRTACTCEANGSGTAPVETRSEGIEVWNRRQCELVAEHVTTWFDSYSGAVRILHGLAHRVDRLAAAGNGQVPAVAACAWRSLFARHFARVFNG